MLCDIRVITVFRVYFHIINDKLCILPKHSIVFGITDPASADRQIEDNIKRLVIRRRIWRFLLARSLGKPIVCREEQLVIHIKPEFARIPFTGKNMKIRSEIRCPIRQIKVPLTSFAGFIQKAGRKPLPFGTFALASNLPY